ncbi:MAG: hypothetical protein L3J39_11755 [Verrucomicrobiales bacterium]|nr:hypothetical protein [Verrucomicrobiales bacterium]
MSQKEPAAKKPNTSSLDRPALWGLTLIFFALAAIFFFLPTGNSIPIPDPASVSPKDIDPSPRFTPLSDPPKAMVNGFERTCMDCHVSIDSQPHSTDLHQHANIELQHGINTRCVTCHDSKNRNLLATLDNKTFTYAQSSQLCSQCHGPVYRQWERGIHGKTLGYWDAKLGKSEKLTCTQCHDPHHPRFDAIKPLPGPNTLRMGDQETGDSQDHGDHKRNPLLLPPHSKTTDSHLPAHESKH